MALRISPERKTRSDAGKPPGPYSKRAVPASSLATQHEGVGTYDEARRRVFSGVPASEKAQQLKAARQSLGAIQIAVHIDGKVQPGRKVSVSAGGRKYNGFVVKQTGDGRVALRLDTPMKNAKTMEQMVTARQEFAGTVMRIPDMLDDGKAKLSIGGRKITAKSHAAVLAEEGSLLLKRNKPMEALERFTQVAELKPDDPRALMDLANMHMAVPSKAGSTDRAIELYDRILKIQPGNRLAQEYLEAAKRMKASQAGPR